MPDRPLKPAVSKRSWLFALLAVLPILTMEQLIEHFARRSALEQERLSTLNSLAILRARLEGLVNSHLLLVHGLSAVIAAHPQIDQTEFARISHGLVNERYALRNIVGAPDLVVSLVYPLAGNEAAMGLDYRTHPIQGDTAQRAMQTRQAVLAGPVPLVQGGIGLIIREPVFVSSPHSTEAPRFWGLISAVIDIVVLYRESGILNVEPNLRLALRGPDGTGAAGEVFFGDPRIFDNEPVTRDITVPGGLWQLAAIPVAGWGQPTTTLWAIRLIGLLAALVVGLMVVLLVRANESLHRQKEILDRTGRLARVGGWEFEVATLQGTWTDETARIHDIEPSPHASASEGLKVFQGQSRATIETALHEAIAYARPYDLELEMTTIKGQRKWVRTIGLPILEAGRVVRLEGAVQDITNRKLAEIEARQRTAMLDSVFQVLPDLFFLIDADGIIQDYRASQANTLYAPPDAFLGRRMQDVLPPPIAEEFERWITQVIQRGDLVTYEYALNMPEGMRYFEARLNRLPEHHQLIAVVRDITDRKQREDEIRQLNAELEERVATRTAELAAINKELETFSYSVSHDLKAPLRGIDGYSRLLLEDHLEQLDEEGRLFLNNVRQGVAQMNELIEDLLAYSRIERRGLNGVALDLARLVEQTLAERDVDLKARHGVVRLDLDTGLMVQADPAGLAIVLRNLLDNAVKFSHPEQPPIIDIHAKIMEQSVILTIRDHGIGFDMQFHDRIFEIFQRLQRAEDYPGTGVGLAMVRKAMQRMGGRVWAESAPGAGAAFHLELPRC